MKIYTQTGDDGSTGLFGGPRVSKDDARIEAYGTVDELNAVLGLVRASRIPAEVDSELEKIQHELFSIGAELATPNPDEHQLRIISSAHIKQLECWIDQHQATLPELKQFILPSGNSATATAHLARSICRRAERRVVTLTRQPGSNESPISAEIVTYLNRLSDLLFVISRVINQADGGVESAWQNPKR